MRTRTTRLEQQHAARKRERFYSKSRWINRVRKQVLDNAGYRCARCHADLLGVGKHAHVHHIIPLEYAPAWASTRSTSRRYARVATTRRMDAVCTAAMSMAHRSIPIIRGMRYVELDRVPSRISN